MGPAAKRAPILPDCGRVGCAVCLGQVRSRVSVAALSLPSSSGIQAHLGGVFRLPPGPFDPCRIWPSRVHVSQVGTGMVATLANGGRAPGPPGACHARGIVMGSWQPVSPESPARWLAANNLIPILGFLVILLVNRQDRVGWQWLLVALVALDLILTSTGKLLNSTTREFIQISRESIYDDSRIVTFLRHHIGDDYRFEAVAAGSLWYNAGAVFQLASTTGSSPLFSLTSAKYLIFWANPSTSI